MCSRVDYRGVRSVCTVFGALALSASAAYAQVLEPPLPSPGARVEQRVGIARFSVEYSSPAVRGRTIWGGVVLLGKRWRSGANRSTKLTASHDFTFGGAAVPAGAYALYTIPGKDVWTFVLNREADAWGMPGPDAAKDVVRVKAKPELAPFRERLTYVFSEATDDSVRLDLEWERLRVPIVLKVDTPVNIAAGLEKFRGEVSRAHLDSARYLFDNGGELKDALSYAETSIALDPTWENHWLRAQILARQGKTGEAVKAAEEARRLGKGDESFEQYYQPEVEKALRDWKKSN